jgi:hypothetical protein
MNAQIALWLAVGAMLVAVPPGGFAYRVLAGFASNLLHGFAARCWAASPTKCWLASRPTCFAASQQSAREDDAVWRRYLNEMAPLLFR